MKAPSWWRRDLVAGDSGPDVTVLQTLLGAPQTGVMDADTLARLRGHQRSNGRPLTGMCGVEDATLIGDVSTYGLTPGWFLTEQWDVLAEKLDGDDDIESAVRRFQSAHQLTPTGIVDEQTAILIG